MNQPAPNPSPCQADWPHPNWLSFLQQQTLATIQQLAAPEAPMLCSLGQFGVLRVSGDDAQSFLQNLLSNDIRELSTTRAQLSSLSSAKGRLLATLLIWRTGDDYLLQMPATLIEPLHKKLGMYVLRAKVAIADASADIVSLGLAGTTVTATLAQMCGELPQQPYGVTEITAGPATGNAIRLGDNRWQINVAPQHAPALWQTLCQHAQPTVSTGWDWLNIRSGMPVILLPTQEQFVAQMVNLDLLGGINFKKGCYPGQEIVARTHYLGKQKRRMYLAHLEGTEAPQPGDALFSADMAGQPSGMIVNAAPAPGGGYDLLASLQIASKETQSVHWRSLQGEALKFLSLPYEIPA